MLAEGQLVASITPRSRKQKMEPLDLLLVINLVQTSGSFRSAESSWLPVCLPQSSSGAFVHMLVHFISVEASLCLILVSDRRDAFSEFTDVQRSFDQHLAQTGLAARLASAANAPALLPKQINVAGLLHFLYKSRSHHQFTSHAFVGPYVEKTSRQRFAFVPLGVN